MNMYLVFLFVKLSCAVITDEKLKLCLEICEFKCDFMWRHVSICSVSQRKKLHQIEKSRKYFPPFAFPGRGCPPLGHRPSQGRPAAERFLFLCHYNMALVYKVILNYIILKELYCIISYRIILYYVILSYIIQYHITLYYICGFLFL